jgi:hypothetical protein
MNERISHNRSIIGTANAKDGKLIEKQVLEDKY